VFEIVIINHKPRLPTAAGAVRVHDNTPNIMSHAHFDTTHTAMSTLTVVMAASGRSYDIVASSATL
jgi:hypothetical protein